MVWYPHADDGRGVDYLVNPLRPYVVIASDRGSWIQRSWRTYFIRLLKVSKYGLPKTARRKQANVEIISEAGPYYIGHTNQSKGRIALNAMLERCEHLNRLHQLRLGYRAVNEQMMREVADN